MDKIYEALLEVQKEMVSIKKDEKNPFFKSSYATLNAVREAVTPILTKYGLVLTQPGTVVEGRPYVATTITHAKSGQQVVSLNEIMTKNLGDAQQMGSGVSYSRRYGLMSLLSLAAEDDDGNGASGKVYSKPKTVEVNLPPVITRAEVENMSNGIKEESHIVTPKKKVSFSRKAVDGDL